jgi:dienelactone hydrolase
MKGKHALAPGLTLALISLSACHGGRTIVPDGGTDLAPAGSVGPPQIQVLSRSAPDAPFLPATRMFWGDQMDLKISGLAPGQAVALVATCGSLQSKSLFHAGADGSIDLASVAPDPGSSYAIVDPEGPLWSATSPDPNAIAEYAISFSLRIGDAEVATAKLDRYWMPDGATHMDVTDGGLVGYYVAPAGAGPHPALITFSGSEGGLDTGKFMAEYWAARGYACLGLAYFGAPGLPQNLEGVPLEYFQQAIEWITKRTEVDANRLGVMGGSRGGELALLLGATYPRVKAVVAQVPSGVVWSCAGTAPPVAAWTYGGHDLPFIAAPAMLPPPSTDAAGNMVYVDAPQFLAALAAASPSALSAATIPVEKTSGGVLILAGEDDELWASCTLGKIAADRLMQSGHAAAHGDGFECYAGAGHWGVGYPGVPTGNYAETYIDAELFALGGSAAANAQGLRASDWRMAAFLKAQLGP